MSPRFDDATEQDGVSLPQRVLEIAKWPEQELGEDWDGGWDDVLAAGAPASSHQDNSVQPGMRDEMAKWERAIQGESFSHPSQPGPNRSGIKIAGVIVLALLLVAAGFYAHQALIAPTPPVPISAAVSGGGTASGFAAPAPAPVTMSDVPIIHPLAQDAPPESPRAARAHKVPRPISNAEDDPLDAPMTFTPETAPPPQPMTGPAIPRQLPSDGRQLD